MQKLVSKYINRLDLELQGFKTELEADKSGITELIEKSNSLINIIYIVVNDLNVCSHVDMN